MDIEAIIKGLQYDKKVLADLSYESLEHISAAIAALKKLCTAEKERDQYKERMCYTNTISESLQSDIDFLRATLDERTHQLESLRAQLKAAQEQEPAIVVKGRKVVGINPAEGTRIEGEFYAAPVPAQKSPAVAVPDVTPEMLEAAQTKTEIGKYVCSNWVGAYGCLTELYTVMASASQVLKND